MAVLSDYGVCYATPTKTMNKFTKPTIGSLHRAVWNYYAAHSRSELPWRKTKDPYKILVSELMLQQTQVSRVIPKYEDFLMRFPTMQVLARAPLGEVLKAWQGLGYNRRAKYLHLAAKQVVAEHKGKLPRSEQLLIQLPGIGKATAAAILAFAFNKPVTYLETNVRSVFLHHFFPGQEGIADAQLLPLIVEAATGQPSREWNWALLDFGAHLKANNPNPNRRSKHHTTQTKFIGSKRQLRGAVLRALSQSGSCTRLQLHTLLGLKPTMDMEVILNDLKREGLVSYNKGRFSLG